MMENKVDVTFTRLDIWFLSVKVRGYQSKEPEKGKAGFLEVVNSLR